MDMVTAPWSYEQIKSIREYQESGRFHELTCGECGAVLEVGRFWLSCPNRSATACRNRQIWVHRSIADGSWREIPPIRFESSGD